MPLRVLFVNEYFPPAVMGGAEVSTSEHAAALAAAGHQIAVLTPNYGGAASDEVTSQGVHIVRMPFPRKLDVGVAANPLYFQNPAYYLYLGWWCWRLARSIDAQIIHVQNSFSLVGAYLGARLAGCALAVTLRDTMHVCSAGAICLHERELPPHRCSITKYRECFKIFQGVYSPGLGRYRRFKANLRNLVEIVDVKIRQRVLRRADLIITVSKALASIYEATGLLAIMPHVVHNPPPIQSGSTPGPEVRARFGIARDSPLILYVGKLSYGKGSDLLLRAAERVHRAFPDAHFVLAGRLSPLIRVPEDPRITALGPLPHQETLSLYAAADIVVLPSVWKEPFPRVLLEAMASHRPVVATKTGGIPELVEDGMTGILVPPQDEQKLADALIRLLREPGTRKRMGEAGYQRLSSLFSSDKSREQLLKAYSGLVS